MYIDKAILLIVPILYKSPKITKNLKDITKSQKILKCLMRFSHLILSKCFLCLYAYLWVSSMTVRARQAASRAGGRREQASSSGPVTVSSNTSSTSLDKRGQEARLWGRGWILVTTAHRFNGFYCGPIHLVC